MHDRPRQLSPSHAGPGLILGTAQLGMDYGVAAGGRPTSDQARAVIRAACECGVKVFDTAQTYGASEAVLGAALPATDDISIITKLDRRVDASDEAAVRRAIKESTRALRRAPRAILLHDPAQASRWEKGVGSTLRSLRARGSVETIGVSVYEPDELGAALHLDGVQLIQAPFNALDRRLLDTDLLDAARALGVELHLRSILLQGVLAMDPERLPPQLRFARELLSSWQRACAAVELSPSVAAIRAVRGLVPRESLVVGCDTPEQVREAAAAFKAGPAPRELLEALPRLPAASPRLIDPRRWS